MIVLGLRPGTNNKEHQMVRLSDLPPADAQHLLDKVCTPFNSEPFVPGPPLAERRVAIVTTAGLHRKGDTAFELGELDYRVIPGEITGDELVMSHVSTNFDRTGFQRDVNVVFPIDRLREFQRAGYIGSVARYHYALNGAGWLPQEISETAAQLSGLLKEDGVNAVLLIPV